MWSCCSRTATTTRCCSRSSRRPPRCWSATPAAAATGTRAAGWSTDPADLAPYGRLCGWVLARAHPRSGDGATISGYLGTGDRFDRAVADFAEAYADQTEADYAAFTRAWGSAPAEGGRGRGTNQRKGDGG